MIVVSPSDILLSSEQTAENWVLNDFCFVPICFKSSCFFLVSNIIVNAFSFAFLLHLCIPIEVYVLSYFFVLLNKKLISYCVDIMNALWIKSV